MDINPPKNLSGDDFIFLPQGTFVSPWRDAPEDVVTTRPQLSFVALCGLRFQAKKPQTYSCVMISAICGCCVPPVFSTYIKIVLT